MISYLKYVRNAIKELRQNFKYLYPVVNNHCVTVFYLATGTSNIHLQLFQHTNVSQVSVTYFTVCIFSLHLFIHTKVSTFNAILSRTGIVDSQSVYAKNLPSNIHVLL